MLARKMLLTLIGWVCFACALMAQTAPKPLTNDDVVSMVKGGLGESTVITAIQSQDNNFDISATALLQLKKSGVSSKVMDAMLSASAKQKAASDAAASQASAARQKAAENAQVQASAAAAGAGQPSVALVQGNTRQLLTPGRAQIVQTKTKASTLSALASDGALSQSLASAAQSIATAGMMHAGSAAGSTAMMAMPMVAPAMMASTLLSHHKPTVTHVWALPGQKAENPLHQTQPAFEVQFAGVPGVNPDEYEPVLLKLEPSSSNFRLVGATQAKQDELEASATDWGMYSSFVEERVAINAKKIASGDYQLQSAQPLAAGEYGVALRPVNKDKKFSGSNVSQNVGDGLIFNSVWAFEVQ